MVDASTRGRNGRTASVGRRLLGTFGVLIVSVALIGLAAAFTLNNLNRTSQTLGRDGAELANELTMVGLDLPLVRAAIDQAIMAPTRDARQKAADSLPSIDAGVVKRLKRVSLMGTPEVQAKAREALGTFVSVEPRIMATLTSAVGGTGDRSATLQAVNRLLQQPVDQIRELTDVQLRSAATYGDAATGSFTAGIVLVVGLLVMAVLLAIVLAVRTLRRLQRSIGGLTDSAGRLAEGDLAARCEEVDNDEFGRIGRSFDAMAVQLDALVGDARRRREELVGTVDAVARFAESVAGGDLTARLSLTGELQDVGKDLNRMVDGLAEISGQVQHGTSALTSSASQILAAVSHHNSSTAEQAASIAQTSVTIDEVRANAEQASSRADELADQARAAATYASQGSDAVAELVAGMDEIDVRVGAIAEGIRELAVRSEAIGAITASVRDLAEQSNMLALNATIEAAKAGEQGRGFAVVADEVRNLAEQSKQATVQVQQILVEIRDATKAAVTATDDGTRVVSHGRERAGRAGELIRQMSGSIEQTAVVASQIARGAKDQALGMDQIGKAIVDVSDTTNEIARSAMQTEQSASSLSRLADRLRQASSQYRLGR